MFEIAVQSNDIRGSSLRCNIMAARYAQKALKRGILLGIAVFLFSMVIYIHKVL